MDKTQNRNSDNKDSGFGSSTSNINNVSSQRREVRCLYDGDKLKSYELKVLGMYKFNEEEKNLYEAFVMMLSKFDEYDRGNIVEDALLDADEQSSLTGFTGFGLPRTKKSEK